MAFVYQQRKPRPKKEQNKVDLYDKVHQCQQELVDTKLYKEFEGLLQDFCTNANLKVNVVCYGIGPFHSSLKSRYQLALIQLLISSLKFEGEKHLYDPVLNDKEKKIAERCGWIVIDKNEEAKRVANSPTIFYMPHCGRTLYNNLLWTNWNSECLSKIAIVGNSFNHYSESALGAKLKEQTRFIEKILPFVTEKSITSEFKISDAFNDTSVHLFEQSQLNKIDATLWKEALDSPPVATEDPELITG